MCVLWAALFAVSAVQAAPEANDPVSRLLSERGLLNTPVSEPPAETPAAQKTALGFVQRMRDKVSNVASDLVLSAVNFLGVPYKRGGQSAESGFDCSGFTRHVFEMSLGLVLPRRSEEQARSAGLLQVKRDELKPGDLVFFNTLKRTFSHVGIYVGDNKFIHAPRSGGEVRIEDMRVAYWTKRYNGARRAPSAAADDAAAVPAQPPAVTTPAAPAVKTAGRSMLPATLPAGMGAPQPALAPHPMH